MNAGLCTGSRTTVPIPTLYFCGFESTVLYYAAPGQLIYKATRATLSPTSIARRHATLASLSATLATDGFDGGPVDTSGIRTPVPCSMAFSRTATSLPLSPSPGQSNSCGDGDGATRQTVHR